MSQPLVSARGLGRRFGRHWALAHVDLDVAPGELIVLAGANGSGKTTLIRVLSGLLERSAGELEIMGLDPARERLACRRHLSVVAHDAFLYGELTAYETLRLWRNLLRSPHQDPELRELLEQVHLHQSNGREVRTFSAGMRKRLTLLRCQLEAPSLILLDEPFAALDPAGQELVEGWIERFRRDGRTVMMASHALSRIGRLDGIAHVLERGQIVWSGRTSELENHFRAS